MLPKQNGAKEMPGTGHSRKGPDQNCCREIEK